MTRSASALSISDDVSSDVAQAILTAQEKWGKDPRELLGLVRAVHDTLRDLSLRSAHNGEGIRERNSKHIKVR